MSARQKEAQLAFMILTRLPVGRIPGEAPSLAASVWAFPLVGLVVGFLMALVFWVATALNLPDLTAALAALAASAAVTGGLHEDGLADTADGFGGGQTISRKLEIMRDSRIGSYGVLALIFTLALTASAIATVGTVATFLTVGALSRCAVLLPMILLRPARADGLGHAAQVSLGTPAWCAFGLSFALAVVSGMVLPTILILGTALAITILAKRQIGGQTGDILGATQKLSECAGWLGIAALA